MKNANKIKKLLAGLLCLCMAAAILPVSAPQAAAASTYDRTYGFYTGAAGLTSAINEYSDYSATDGRYWSFIKSDITRSSWAIKNNKMPLQISDKSTTAISTQVGDYIALKINVPAGGSYKATLTGYNQGAFSADFPNNEYHADINVYAIPYSDDAVAAAESRDNVYLTEEYKIGSAINFYDASMDGTSKSDPGTDGYVDRALEDLEVKAAGDYILVLQVAGMAKDGSSAYMYLREFSLEYQSECEVTGDTVLGKNYAYLNKTADGSWTVDFFGGVKTLAGYSEVGFMVSYVDESGISKTEALGSENVYTKITAKDGDLEAFEFDADAQWIFNENFVLSDIDETQEISFKAYAVAADGTTVYGNTYTATIQ